MGKGVNLRLEYKIIRRYHKNCQDLMVRGQGLECNKEKSSASDYNRVAKIRLVHSLRITTKLGQNTNSQKNQVKKHLLKR